ncbi:MAG: cytochrome c-type biogenesis protein CcmH [Acidobacteriota bacterium]
MSRLRNSLLVAALAALCLAQGGENPLLNERVRRLGEQLGCQCGCGSSVTSCNMLECHFASPARKKLLALVNAGESDSAILDSFVKEYGPRVLLKPPAEGFNLVGWVMPFVGLAFGLAFVWWVIKRFRRPVAVAGGPGMDDATLARYQERIDKDLEKLD